MKKYVLAAILAVGLALTPFISCFATEVSLQHRTFDVEAVTVRSGESISFVNKSDSAVNVQVIDAHGNSDDKGLQQPGEAIQAIFMTPGEYRVRDAMHPKMTMRVTVKAEPNGPTVTSR